MMKSIMEEASSVIKAIEKGWIQAGKPQEFTIKVFEEATKNFIGMTVHPAKIAIFFQEKGVQQQPARQKPAHPKALEEQKARDVEKNRGMLQNKNRTAREQKPSMLHNPTEKQHAHQKNSPSTPVVREQTNNETTSKKENWTPEMVAAAQDWMKGLFSSLDKHNLEFSTEVKNYYLKITLATPAIADSEQEKMLFRNCAYLIMQSMRNKFKKSFRGFKVILSSTR